MSLVVRSVAFSLAVLAAQTVQAQAPPNLQKITINYATRTGTTWPLYIAKEGGYFEKYGLDANLVFGVHPVGIAMIVSGQAEMTNYPLEQAMPAVSKDGSMILVGSSYRKSSFALIANQKFKSVKELKGKTIAVSQIGDAPYNYAVGLLSKAGLTPRDVEWIPIGTDVNGRAAALASGRVDATMLTAPVFYQLERQGFRTLANTSDFDDIYAPTVYVYKKTQVAANPKLPELLIKVHAEAIKRLYDDKEFALKAYLKYNPDDDRADLGKVYDLYTKSNTYERVPYLSAAAVKYMLDHPTDPKVGEEMRKFDFRSVIDNATVDRLVKEGFFEKLFGSGIKAEQERKAKLAFR